MSYIVEVKKFGNEYKSQILRMFLLVCGYKISSIFFLIRLQVSKKRKKIFLIKWNGGLDMLFYNKKGRSIFLRIRTNERV